ncbi:TetR/AcrR family transcriptional regulator [Cryptosporangium sp. NPDC051539]|uniref:TetR/AcrR family transcriptional regulator n=1 Tax=Cryptosporangium sp. NPDC051539 TaxID=3363962 RepID=UPI0037A3AA85
MSSELATQALPGTPPAPDRRTRGRVRRRDAVYAAAIGLFVERGYDNTTMDEIAERADVARATVFNHFQRKAAFLDEWSSRRRDRALGAVRAEEHHALREVLQRYMVELGNLSSATRPETVALMGAAVHNTNVLGDPPLAHEIAKLLTDSGELAESVDPELAGLLLATGYFATLTRWIDTDPPFDLTEQLLRMLDLVLTGVLPA